MLPQFADQFDNAECAVPVGVAVSLQLAEITREAVADRVRRILAGTTAIPGLTQISNELAEGPDIGIVVVRIELLIKHFQRYSRCGKY
jgi:UDP:flavonoid glycosyltransferase YjiC (YdhE family)